jgi:hypothetical protein
VNLVLINHIPIYLDTFLIVNSFFEAMDDLDTKQQHELSVELNDKTKLNNIIRSMDNTSGMHVTKQDRSESALAKQKEKELEELQPYLKPELQFELDEDIKFKVIGTELWIARCFDLNVIYRDRWSCRSKKKLAVEI